MTPELHVLPGSRIGLEIPADSPATARLVFDAPACETVRPVPVGVPVTLFCELSEPASYPYRVEGFGAGAGVVVVDPVNWVTLAARRRVVVYGGPVVLGGTAYPGQPCSPPPARAPRLVVEGRAVGTARFARRARTGLAIELSGGALARRTAPALLDLYRALWSEHYSRTLRVDVRPRVTLRRSANRYLRVTVRSARSCRGRWVALQRRTGRGWRFARAVHLGRGSTAKFRPALRRGVVRIYVPRSVAGRGYVAGFSRPIQLR